MTVSTLVNENNYTATGSDTFPYTFKIFSDSDLVVYDDSVLQTLMTHYTVTGEGVETGGNVVFVTAPTVGNAVRIVRSMPLTQAANYVDGDIFPADSHENALDKLTMEIQDAKYLMDAHIAGTTPLPLSSLTVTGTGSFGKIVVGSYDFVPWVDVTLHGATGDGVTDDTLAIQAAIDSVTTGTVIFPSGTFVITSPIEMKSGISLVGMGMSSTIIENQGTGIAIRYNGTLVSPIRKTLIADLKILDSGTGTDGIYMYYACQNNTIDRVWIRSAGQHGINLNKSFSNVIRDCLIELSVNYGILVDTESNDTTIEENHIISNDKGIYLTNDSTKCRIRDNSIESNITAGLVVYHDTGTLSSITIRDNYFENNGDDCIKIYCSLATGARGIQIEGNYFYTVDVEDFIDIDYGDDITIKDNTFGDGNAGCVHIRTTNRTGILNWYPNIHYGTSFNASSHLSINADSQTAWIHHSDAWLTYFDADDATPSVLKGYNYRTANVNPTTITAFDDGIPGKKITVSIRDALTTIDFTGTTLKGNGGGDWSPANGDWMEAIYDGYNWYCAVHDCT